MGKYGALCLQMAVGIFSLVIACYIKTPTKPMGQYLISFIGRNEDDRWS